MNRALPSATYLRECFIYNADTGELFWKVRPTEHFSAETECVRWNKRYGGKAAGTIARYGYHNIGICGVRYQVHRVIWKLMTGEDPTQTIDHIDGRTGNNSWVNLRLATTVQQSHNMKMSKANTSGRRGVHKKKNRWQAFIGVEGVQRYLGSFKSIEEASAAREAAARKLHGAYYREAP